MYTHQHGIDVVGITLGEWRVHGQRDAVGEDGEQDEVLEWRARVVKETAHKGHSRDPKHGDTYTLYRLAMGKQ